MTYRSASISVPSVIQASCMCRTFIREICVQIQYLTGCLEKCLSRPPVMCRQEWHDSVYAQSKTTLARRIREPSPKPKLPSGPRNACDASQVFSTETSNTKKNKYRCRFCTISGNLLSPVYLACGSRTAHAVGACQNDR